MLFFIAGSESTIYIRSTTRTHLILLYVTRM